ncbi:MAG: LacI family DNA-binding transcriptional regulator, partial [Pseudomonadota bacterium]
WVFSTGHYAEKSNSNATSSDPSETYAIAARVTTIPLRRSAPEYRPNIYAINQNRRQTKTVGLVVPNLIDPFFAAIARMIEGMITDAGYNPVLFSSHGGPKHEIANLESLQAIKPAGVLLAPLGRASDQSQLADFAADVPTVLFDANLDGVGEAFFGSDNGQSIDLIVEYLCKTGEPPVFFEMKRPVNPNAFKRRNAYAKAMERQNVDPCFLRVDGDGWNFEEIGYREGNTLLDRGALPSNTVLCSNDRLAIGFLSAAYDNGLRIGTSSDCDLRVAGHDDHPFSRFTCPSLTTVSQDYNSIAARSVATLLDLIFSDENKGKREVTLFEGSLVIRNSA